MIKNHLQQARERRGDFGSFGMKRKEHSGKHTATTIWGCVRKKLLLEQFSSTFYNLTHLSLFLVGVEAANQTGLIDILSGWHRGKEKQRERNHDRLDSKSSSRTAMSHHCIPGLGPQFSVLQPAPSWTPSRRLRDGRINDGHTRCKWLKINQDLNQS